MFHNPIPGWVTKTTFLNQEFPKSNKYKTTFYSTMCVANNMNYLYKKKNMKTNKRNSNNDGLSVIRKGKTEKQKVICVYYLTSI